MTYVQARCKVASLHPWALGVPGPEGGSSPRFPPVRAVFPGRDRQPNHRPPTRTIRSPSTTNRRSAARSRRAPRARRAHSLPDGGLSAGSSQESQRRCPRWRLLHELFCEALLLKLRSVRPDHRCSRHVSVTPARQLSESESTRDQMDWRIHELLTGSTMRSLACL